MRRPAIDRIPRPPHRAHPLDYVELEPDDEPLPSAPNAGLWIAAILIGAQLCLGVALFAHMIGALK
ncbi:MAG: hypothetical protein M9944_07840 [Rhizobiaceae bacterium]|nr:hypothetical protein [Rhizobiaceae bacterium]